MNTNEQIKALAELDGYTASYNKDNGLWHWLNESNGHVKLFGNGLSEEHLIAITNYLTSYDAIIPLIQKLGKMDAISFVGWLIVTKFDFNFGIDESAAFELITATPSQLCEALLRATGKWKE
jgi:hypothetical protein